MGLNPIDLQTMYAQLNNVAKQASAQTQGAQLSQAMHEANVVEKNLEEARKVVQARESAKSGDINLNAEGRNAQDGHSSKGKKEGEEEEKQTESSSYGLKESYLGQHIDIKG